MRLWHKTLISVLPRQQLVSQLRECVLIAKNIYEGKTKIHCLINPLFNYPISHFVKEMLESILERINLYMRYTDKHIEDFKEEFNRKLSNAFDFFKKG